MPSREPSCPILIQATSRSLPAAAIRGAYWSPCVVEFTRLAAPPAPAAENVRATTSQLLSSTTVSFSLHATANPSFRAVTLGLAQTLVPVLTRISPLAG